ncbi:hypothetical protein CFB44_14730 [Burkholderia sp. AU31280]|nr:hypothetical protein CFB44_14730 [Burkholderia sp. AU31280]
MQANTVAHQTSLVQFRIAVTMKSQVTTSAIQAPAALETGPGAAMAARAEVMFRTAYRAAVVSAS